ncbi:MAG TPA: hypothetical protein VHT91_45280 [Kofleriaceae bacterium]|nr:hypothetical protein [Kofleriaceae bacterium]
MTLDRFAYGTNLERATGHPAWNHAFAPPAYDYRLFYLDLANEVPTLSAGLHAELETLRAGVEAEWTRCRALGGNAAARMPGAATIARCLRRIAELLPGEADRRALGLRADVIERGHLNGTREALAGIDEDITIVAGKPATWYGQSAGGLPAAFGCVRDTASQASVIAARARLGDVTAYLLGLHEYLRLGEIPGFTATRLFFMAGEGDRNPKHIAYFLPQDEGVERCPFQKTYYFANTHRALIDAVSLPLGRRLLNLGLRLPASAASFGAIPVLGVLAHQFGRSVLRSGTFAALDAADRWASCVLQETAAGVFGTLVLAELLAPRLGLEPSDVVAYHLAECLRYVDRGLGHFPDSDGAYLQLNYLASSGALVLDGGVPRLTGDPAAVILGFRSMARVLADTLLTGQIHDALAFYRAYGPAGSHALHPLLVALREEPPKTIEYRQEPRITVRAREASPSAVPATNPARDTLRDFYCRPVGDTALNRYEVWERGEAVGDSVTPSSYCPEYRTHMVLKILSLPRPHDHVFSIGCGNAFVEANLQSRGLPVQAIDCLEEAVALAASKGVDAFTADYHALPPGHLASFGVVYADGLLGHLYHPETGLTGFFETLLALKPSPGSWLVLSNDAPAQPGAGVAPHGKVPGFWLFSSEYLRDVAQRFGYTVVESYSFPYERPVSGLRNRTICVARVAGGDTAAA